jgi:hypothetical protein
MRRGLPSVLPVPPFVFRPLVKLIPAEHIFWLEVVPDPDYGYVQQITLDNGVDEFVVSVL